MRHEHQECPDCTHPERLEIGRREFLRGVTATAAAVGSGLLTAIPSVTAAPSPKSKAETNVKKLYDTLTPEQRKAICFPWDHQVQGDRRNGKGLLRTFISNNWQITPQNIADKFFTDDQRDLIRAIYTSMLDPEWVKKIDRQLKDDTGGRPWGSAQSIALFGEPGKGKFELVMTGRHLTMRADGNSESHVALGGPIFHGHAASGFNEKVGHPGNIFWHQAQAANGVYRMLSGKQQKQALVANLPTEQAVGFRGPKGTFPGIPVSELSRDQKEALEKVLLLLIEPYRSEDREEVRACLKAQGGLEKCSLAFYQEEDLGDDGEWDNWRLEGPSFVWYFRGTPHVHIWINVADDASVQLNA